MRKISVKVKVKYTSEATLPLKEAGKRFGPEFSQFDRVFLPRHWDKHYQNVELTPRIVIRTNTVKKKASHLMIFKRPLDNDSQLVFQTQIMDYNQLANIVHQMGYELYAEVPKKRQELTVGRVKFYLDNIDGYGNYLKLEKTLEPEESVNRDELWALLETLDLKHAESAPRYSDIIVMEGRDD